jgi:polysaccharide export outer membrane protein
MGIYGGGCAHTESGDPAPLPAVPRELGVVSLERYVLEPPDILLISAIRAVPKPPYRLEPLDALLIQTSETLPNERISGIYGIDLDGSLNLGLGYGRIPVAGLTIQQAEEAIYQHLARRFTKITVAVALSQIRAVQQISGEHLVRPDGTVSLGVYGDVHLAGLTLPQARYVIEQHLSQYLIKPEVSLDVFAYNSKFYYIIADGAGYGQQIVRLPVTGKETVLDAISQIYGLPSVASKKHIWVARPNGLDPCQEQVLPVDWDALTRCGNPATNYQLMPNDRIYVQSDTLIHANNALSKLVSPIERMFGVTLLGTSTVQSFQYIRLLANTKTFGNTGVIATTR